MSEPSVILGIAAILLAGWIVWRQKTQLRRLEEIGTETNEIAAKMQSQGHTERLVGSLFGSLDKYTCALPARFDRKPLPFVEAGDYHAFQLLSNRLGETRITLEYVNRDSDWQGPEPKNNHIFICTPYSNAKLRCLFPCFRHQDLTSRDFAQNYELPAWFAEADDDDTRHWIEIFDEKMANPRLASGCEPAYVEAAQLAKGKRYVPKGSVENDYAVFARITKYDRTMFVMAGIHQFGTCVAGEFVDSLVRGDAIRFRDIFFGKRDFFAIIWGTFNYETLSVKSHEVVKDYIWYRGPDAVWVKVEPDHQDRMRRGTDVRRL